MVEEGEIDEVYKSDSDSAWSLRVPVAEDEDKFEVARGVSPRLELVEDRGWPQGDWTARGCWRVEAACPVVKQRMTASARRRRGYRSSCQTIMTLAR